MQETAEKLNSLQKPVLCLVRQDYKAGPEKQVIYCNSGPFYVMVVAILFACLGLLFNIGLRIQNINYQKEIYSLNGIIALEESRTDRLDLEISSLRSPSRILVDAGDRLEMKQEDAMEIVGIPGKDILDNEKIYDYISRENMPAIPGNYDSFLGTIYYFQDIIMVVSESVLTFFIP